MARPKTVTNSPLSAQALSLLAQLFAKNSNLTLPAGVADAVVEIREWATAQLTPASNVVNFPTPAGE